MTETPQNEFSVGQTVVCGFGENFQSGVIVAISQDGKTAFVHIGYNLMNNKARFITISTQKLKAVKNEC